MKRSLQALLLIAVALTLSSAFASGSGPARTELELFASDLDSFQAEFTQTVKSQDGRIQDQTEGRVWLQSPDKLRWVYSGEFPETIVADGTNIWIHDQALEQVTVKPQSAQATDSPLMILADISQLDEQFRVTELGDFEDMLLLELKSLDTESEFERILLGLSKGDIRLMAMEDAFGLRTEIHFVNTAKNQSLEPGIFNFIVPEETDVVGVPNQPE